jgi:hypothetical protein
MILKSVPSHGDLALRAIVFQQSVIPIDLWHEGKHTVVSFGFVIVTSKQNCTQVSTYPVINVSQVPRSPSQ